MNTTRRALILSGGWSGHQPEHMAQYARTLLGGFEVVCTHDLDSLTDETLSAFDVILPIWSMGELTEAHERALVAAVERGLGLVAWHGSAGAFRASRAYHWLLGGQFVGHLGDDGVPYSVHFNGGDPLVAGLEALSVTSEQYYLLVDPAVQVVATTRVVAPGASWLQGVDMPVAWKRRWGSGRVFYCSLGHSLDIVAHPTVKTLLTRAVCWAAG